MNQARLPIQRFSTEFVEPATRFEAFRMRINSMFDMETPARDRLSRFAGEIQSVNLGSMLISSMTTESFLFERPRRKIMRDFLDHILLRVDLDAAIGRNGRPLALTVIDLGRISEPAPTPASNISLVIPRRLLGGSTDAISRVHGHSLRHPPALFLAEHLASLMRLSDGAEDAMPAIADALTPALIAACLDTQPATLVAARPDMELLLLGRARQYIEVNLRNPMLSPESLARALGMSRSALYRLFEPVGGVARAIREARLKQAMREIRQSGTGSRLSDIAFELGFGSDAHFSRAFRAYCGCTPATTAPPSRAGTGPPPGSRTLVDIRANVSSRSGSPISEQSYAS